MGSIDPHPRGGERQRVCSAAGCQRERHRRSYEESRAATTVDGRNRKQLERVCCYLLRPPFAHDAVVALPDAAAHRSSHGEALKRGRVRFHGAADRQRVGARPSGRVLRPCGGAAVPERRIQG